MSTTLLKTYEKFYELNANGQENPIYYANACRKHNDVYALAAIRAKFPTDKRTDKELLKLVRQEYKNLELN